MVSFSRLNLENRLYEGQFLASALVLNLYLAAEIIVDVLDSGVSLGDVESQTRVWMLSWRQKMEASRYRLSQCERCYLRRTKFNAKLTIFNAAPLEWEVETRPDVGLVGTYLPIGI